MFHIKSLTGSEYLLGFKYFRVLSIPGLSICQGSEFSGLHRIPVSVNMTIMNMSRDPVTERFWIFQDSRYTRFLHMQALHNVPNMLEYGYIIHEYLFFHTKNFYKKISSLKYLSCRFWKCWFFLELFLSYTIE